MSYQDRELDVKDMNYLVGKHVKSAIINPDNDLVVLITNDELIYLSWFGDCCAHCFLANVSGASFLEDATILEVESKDWVSNRDEEYGDTTETMGTKLKTSKGYVDLETRVNHNGYYAGYLEVSINKPYGQYSDSRIEDTLKNDMKPLRDF